MTSHRFTYRPGTAAAVCVGDWALLVGLPVHHPLVGRLYALLARTPTMGEITDVLAGSYGEYTDVLVLHATDPVEVFLWGSCGVESTEGLSVAGGPMGTEQRLSGLVGAWLGHVVVPSGGMLPAGLGVFPADRLETTPVPVATAAPHLAPEPVGGPPHSVPEPVSTSYPLPEPVEGPYSVSGRVSGRSPVPEPVEGPPHSVPEPVSTSYPVPELVEGPYSVPGRVSGRSSVPEPVEGILTAGSPSADGPAAAPAPAVAQRPRAEQPYVPVAPPPMSADEQPTAVDVDGARPLVVLARRCPEGHMNPAYLDACAVCGNRLSGTPFEMPPAGLGRLVISTGGEVVLDHDVILGRNPRLPEGLTGPPPELVKVTDPAKDVSNRHLLVRVVDQQVLVSDLGSTNGTEVVRPGWPAVPLVAGQEVGVEPGTRIVLAGSVVLTYEA